MDTYTRVAYEDGLVEYFNGKLLHRINGPAVIHSNGAVEYFVHGTKYDPENINSSYTYNTHIGLMLWINKIYGPIQIFDNGTVSFHEASAFVCEGFAARPRGPGTVFPNGRIHYLDNRNRLHRTDGPAVRWGNTAKEYWIHGQQITELEFFLKYKTV